MTDADYKKYTKQAKAGIKGEAFFESLISDYSIPHHVVGPKDVGIDYFCEWVFGDKPTGILYGVQVKTLSAKNVKRTFVGINKDFNGLEIYEISSPILNIDDRVQNYWRGLGLPIFLFVVIYPEPLDQGSQLDCYYKRFTPILTTAKEQEDQKFYKVNKGSTFLAFADYDSKKYGFARDLFIDLMRCSYSKGSISYISPRTLGLEQFHNEDAIFADLFNEYSQNIIQTFRKTERYLEGIMNNIVVPTAAPPDEPGE
jgi:hypothetical protein